MNQPGQPGQPGQPPHPGVPQNVNPALAGQQPGAATQPQYSQQLPQHSGLVDPNLNPVSSQQYIGINLTANGPQVPCPVGPDGQPGPLSSQLLMQMLGGQAAQAPSWIILTWVETLMALSVRDMHMDYLERRVADLEKRAGVTPVAFDVFMRERQAAMMAALQAQQAQQNQQPQQAGQQTAPYAPQQQPQQAPQQQTQQAPQQQTQQPHPGQTPQGGGHGMPGGQ